MSTARSITEREVLENLDWVRKLARRLVGDGADDLVQNVCVAALDRGRIDTKSCDDERPRVRAWLARAASYLASNERRAESRRGARERRVARAEAQAATADVVARNALVLRVVEAVDRLEEPYRTTLLLRYLDELSVREVATRLDVSEAVVRKRVSRSLSKLRADLAQRGIDRRLLTALAPFPHFAAKAAVAPILPPTVGVLIMGTGKLVAGVVVAGAAATFAIVANRAPDLDAGHREEMAVPISEDAALDATREERNSADARVSAEPAQPERRVASEDRVVRRSARVASMSAEKLAEMASREAELQEMAVALDMLNAEQQKMSLLTSLPADGLHVERYPSGKTKASGSYKNGHREGVWSTWHENGVLESRGPYFAGKRHGSWAEWDASGDETLRGDYRYARREGSFAFVKDGKKVAADYRDGKLHGSCRTTTRDGKLVSDESWFAGRKHGASIRYHANGRPASRGRYVHGFKVGLWEYSGADGKLDAARSGGVQRVDRGGEIKKRRKAVRDRLDAIRKMRGKRN